MTHCQMTSPELEHFPSLGERARSATRHMARGGRLSPTHSAHDALIRSSLVKMQTEKRAKKVRFYRNGDRHFEGMTYAISVERFRTFEALMAELTQSPIGDKIILPNGVRNIFTLDGEYKVTSLEELEEGESYVCASTNFFRKIDYPRSSNPNWSVSSRGFPELGRSNLSANLDSDASRDFIRPKLVTVIRNGTKPRKAVRILLNKKTAHSFDQVLNDITQAINCGVIKRIVTLEGLPVECLQDFFLDVNVFVAYGCERQTLDDYGLSNNEIRFVSAYKSVRQTERITLRSPKVQRKFSFNASQLNGNGDAGGRSGARGMTPLSPASARKRRDLTPRVKSAPGWKNGADTLGNGHQALHIAPAPPKLTAKYRVGKTIGQGNFAVVKDCVEKQTKERFALKIISKSLCRGREEIIQSEVSILRCLKHSNVVQLVEDYETSGELFLIMELVTGGDLFDAIASASSYTERDASGMLYNLASAVSHLHSRHIVHRDIKPENILVCEHGDGTKSLKLGDFGLAIEARTPLFTVCGTPTYVAPETLAETGYGLKVDIWAIGVITYILLCGFPPFASETANQEELFEKITSGKYEFTAPFWDGISESAKELISYMLQHDAEDRYTATELLQHVWLSDDTAKDEDMHVGVARRIEKNFLKSAGVTDRQPAMNLIACTALDHGSRYFQGKGPALQALHTQASGHDDEVF